MRVPETRLEIAARWVSYVLDPFVVLGLLSVWFFTAALVSGQGWERFLWIYLLNTVPVGLVFMHIMQKQGFRDWDIHRQAWRMPIWVTWWASQTAGIWLASRWEMGGVVIYLSIFWLIITAYMLLTLKWKVSVHTGVLATLASLVWLRGGWDYGWVWFLVGLVAWARIVRRDHTPVQVLLGGAVPPLVVMWGVVLFS